MEPLPLLWIDGRLAPAGRPALRADDGAFREGQGCTTSVRIAGGRPRFAARHAARLRGDAAALGLGALEESRTLAAIRELAAAALPGGEGVVRLQASRSAGELRLLATAQALSEPPGERDWSAVVPKLIHPGPAPWGGAKVTSRLHHSWAARAAREAGADEALLLDAAGRLVEGARSNVFVAGRDGGLATPPLERGAVAGIARAVALERIREVAVRDVLEEELRGAAAVFAVNAVRGARRIATLDGRPLGDAPAWHDRLDEALAED